MQVIGITGGLACGKTEAAKIVHRLTKAPVIDADKLSHGLIKPGSKCWKKIAAVFGGHILGKNKAVNRELLGEIVFTSKKQLKRLENILHPPVKAIIKKEIAYYRRKGEKKVLLDAPLLIEAGLLNTVDKLIVIHCPKKLQIKRFAGNDKKKKLKAVKIIASQMPLKEKIKVADFSIKNNGSLKELKNKIKNLLDKLELESYTL